MLQLLYFQVQVGFSTSNVDKKQRLDPEGFDEEFLPNCLYLHVNIRLLKNPAEVIFTIVHCVLIEKYVLELLIIDDMHRIKFLL